MERKEWPRELPAAKILYIVNAGNVCSEIGNSRREMKKTNQYVESNIFNSVTNVNLSTVIAYKQNGIVHDFLEDYDKRSE